MSYIHNGQKPVSFRKDPVDPDTLQDVVFFAADPWLRDWLAEELIDLELEAIVTGAELIEGPRSVGPMQDDEGTVYQYVYTVIYGPIDAGANEVQITFRKSTQTTLVVGLGRTDHDHTIIIPVNTL